MPAFVVDARNAVFFVGLDLDQHVTREELALGTALLAGTHFDHFLGRDQDITEALLHLVTHDAIAQGLRNRLFEARIGVNDVPTLHWFLLIDPGTTGSLSESGNQIRPAAG
ncbi:hypothetical protein D3C72_1408560 [compost metagenome]